MSTDFAAQNNATQPEINDCGSTVADGVVQLLPTELAQVDTALGNINPELPALYTNDGMLTDPNYLTYLSDPAVAGITNSTGELVGAYGGYNPIAGAGRPGDVVPRQPQQPDGPHTCRPTSTLW